MTLHSIHMAKLKGSTNVWPLFSLFQALSAAGENGSSFTGPFGDGCADAGFWKCAIISTGVSL